MAGSCQTGIKSQIQRGVRLKRQGEHERFVKFLQESEDKYKRLKHKAVRAGRGLQDHEAQIFHFSDKIAEVQRVLKQNDIRVKNEIMHYKF